MRRGRLAHLQYTGQLDDTHSPERGPAWSSNELGRYPDRLSWSVRLRSWAPGTCGPDRDRLRAARTENSGCPRGERRDDRGRAIFPDLRSARSLASAAASVSDPIAAVRMAGLLADKQFEAAAPDLERLACTSWPNASLASSGTNFFSFCLRALVLRWACRVRR